MLEKNSDVILLVEDNEDDVFLLEQALAAAGVRLQIRLARDGDEAVQYLEGSGTFADREKFPYPTAVFLDLKLPYRSGTDILRWAAKEGHLPKLFVVVLTSSDEPRDIKTCYDLGARTYLVKPPAPDMIRDIVRSFRLNPGWSMAVASFCMGTQLGI